MKKTVIATRSRLAAGLLIQALITCLTLLSTLSTPSSCQIIQSNSSSGAVLLQQNAPQRPAKVPLNPSLQKPQQRTGREVPARPASGSWTRSPDSDSSDATNQAEKPMLISKTWKQQQTPCSPVNEHSHSELPIYYSPSQPDVGDNLVNNSRDQLEKLEKLLSRRYKIYPPVQPVAGASVAPQENDGKVNLLELPRPSNVTLFIISWYPPVLKLSWNLDELGDQSAALNFYSSFSQQETGKTSQNDTNQQFDLELALGSPADEATRPDLHGQDGGEADEDAGLEPKLAAELRHRRLLIRKSLTCFQVTYNIINSRFKVIEEYPPYLRSILMERLLPATEYSLRVGAVYLGKFRQFSERVHFVSPTDNESRRFKENTYRPIHRYPDDRSPLRIGLAQVRCEELTIVAIAVLFWLATICLFFNKWGKIRMLEPYQPAYRESSSTASLITASAAAAAATDHHHPSLHNLTSAAGSYVGPTLITSASATVNQPIGGNKLASAAVSTCAPLSPTNPNETGSQLAATCTSPASSTGTVVPAHTGAAAQGSQLHERRSDGSTAGAALGALGRRSSKSMLLLGGHKRFDSLTSDSIGAGPNSHDLNFLFQSKALALAKATSMWSRHQQKLRLLQCRAAALQGGADPSVPSSLQQLGAIRRTSQALLRQRGAISQQQQQPQIANATSLQHQSVEHHHMAAGGSLDRRRESRAPLSKLASTTTEAASRTQLLRRSHQSQRTQQQDDWPKFWSLDKQQESEQATDGAPAEDTAAHPQAHLHQQLGQSASNKLRRLLFTTRTHQHHHIATSTSSSTIQASGSSLSTSQQQSPMAHHTSTSSGFATPKMNSASLDNDQPTSAATIRQRLDSANQRPAPACGSSPPLLSDTSSAVSLRAPLQGQAADSSPALNATTSLDEPGPALEHDPEPQRCASAVPMILSQAGDMGSKMRMAGHKEQRQSLMEHHILIEPPSPPNQRDLLEFQSSECLNGEQRHRAAYAASEAGQGNAPLDGQTSAPSDVAGDQFVGGLQQQHQADCWRPATGDLRKPQQQIEARPTDHKHATSDSYCTDLGASCHPSGRPLACRRDNKSPPPQLGLAGTAEQVGLDSANWQPCHPAASDYCCLAQAAGGGHKPLSLVQDLQDNATPQSPVTLNYQQDQRDNSQGAVDFLQLDDCERTGWVERRAREAFARLVDYQQETAAAVQASINRHCPCCCCPSHCPIATSVASAVALAAGCSQQVSAQVQSASQLARAQHQKQQQQLLPRQHSRHRSLCTDMHQLSTTSANQHHRGSVQFQVSDHSSSSALTVDDGSQMTAETGEGRPRMSSIFVSSPYTRAHRDSFAMLRALSQKKSKSAEDVAYLSSLVLQIWARDPNPLLQSVSQQHLTQQSSTGSSLGHVTRRQQSVAGTQPLNRRQRPKSSLTVAHI